MRRFTDPILFGVLFVLDVLAWLILSATSGIETADPGRIAPMNVGTVIVIAAQALALATVVGLVRALLKAPPRRFYMWALGLAVVSAVISGVAALPARTQNIEVGMSWAVWSNSILAFVFLIALIIAITGGIPTEPEVAEAGQNSAKPAKKASALRAPQALPIRENETTPETAPVTQKPTAQTSAQTRPAASTPQPTTPKTPAPASAPQTLKPAGAGTPSRKPGEPIPVKPSQSHTTLDDLGNAKDGQ